jgi:hypothetical protein
MTINNNNIFGAFTLGEVRSGRLTGEWLNKESVANYGWFGGGSVTTSYPTTPGSISVVDRIDFSNDSVTALSRGTIIQGGGAGFSSGRRFGAAIGNSNYGWFGGGSSSQATLTPPAVVGTKTYPESSIERIDFSNDSTTASIRGPLSQARSTLAAAGNSNYGWFSGGFSPAIPGRVTTVERIDFSNDSSNASLRGPLSLVRDGLAATGNSNYGWFGGGSNPATPAYYSLLDRIDFANDAATASVRGSLSSPSGRTELAATGNSNYGWFGGGVNSSAFLSIVDRIDFSNDSGTASIRGPLSQARGGLAATGNSNYGWFGGGNIPGPNVVATVNRIDFSNDTGSSSPRGSLSLARSYISATSGVLNIRRQKAGNYGWFGGGYAPATTRSTVDRIDFSNDSSTASVRGPLVTARRYKLAATGNSNYGWFGGGDIPVVATVDRIDFSNDSPSALVRGPLSQARRGLSATGNSNYGWFGGGAPSPSVITDRVDRIDFSNDSALALLRGPLSSARYALAATGNSNYGWFFNGSNPTATEQSRVDRVDFSSDSTTALPRGITLTPSAKQKHAATGNSNYGWFGGGEDNFDGLTSKVFRINFSNDSALALLRGPLNAPSGRNDLAATGNSNYGWFGGGGPGSGALVDRIDFSNDSVSASPRGLLSLGRVELAATSNTNK